MTVFKAYDVRAVYPEPLDEETAHRIGQAAATLLLGESGGEGRVVVGHDMRLSSPPLCAALKTGICDAGADVVDVGLVDTPLVTFAVKHLGAIGGIQTTASHNPAQYNGFKICRSGAKPVGMGSGLEVIQEMVEGDRSPLAAVELGSEQVVDLWEEYRRHVFGQLDPRIQSGEVMIRAAIDASNGMAGTMVPKVFRGVPGLDLVEINFENDKGTFVHEPNPLVEENLAQVREAVIAKGCDLGICFDGDADRCMVVDDRGEIVGCDLITAWLAPRFLRDEPAGGAIVYDLRSSKAVAKAIESSGGRAVRSRVGHVFMKQKMAEHDAPFGGELSGHFYFRDNAYADSGAMAFAAVVSALVDADRSMSELTDPLRMFSQSGEINFETEDKQAAMDAIAAAYPGAAIDHLDGVTIDCGDWWCNVRPSNTEPLLRLNLEASSPQAVESRVADVSGYLGARV